MLLSVRRGGGWRGQWSEDQRWVWANATAALSPQQPVQGCGSQSQSHFGHQQSGLHGGHSWGCTLTPPWPRSVPAPSRKTQKPDLELKTHFFSKTNNHIVIHLDSSLLFLKNVFIFLLHLNTSNHAFRTTMCYLYSYPGWVWHTFSLTHT